MSYWGKIFKYFFFPLTRIQDTEKILSHFKIISLQFKNQGTEQSYIQHQKDRIVGLFRIFSIIIILTQIIYFINIMLISSNNTLKYLRLSFLIWNCILFIFHTKLTEKNLYYIDLIQFVNSFFNVLLTLLYIDESSYTNQFYLLKLGIVLQLQTYTYQFVCVSYITKIIIYIFSCILVLIRYDLLRETGIWAVAPILFMIVFLLRMKDYNKRLDYYMIYKEALNLQACIEIFDQIVPSSILILQKKNYSETVMENSINNMNILYKNKYADEHLQNNQLINLWTELKGLQNSNESNDINQVPTNQISQMDFKQDDENFINFLNKKLTKASTINQSNYYQSDYKIKKDISDHIFYISNQASKSYRKINDDADFPIKDFYDIKIADCIWDKQEAILILMNNVSEKFKIQHLNQLDQYKDILLASVSHDLKTPLNGMSVTIQIIQQKLKNKILLENQDIKELNKLISNVQQGQDLLLFMINDLLDYSQINKGTFRLQIEKFNIQETLEFIRSLFKTQAELKNISYIVDSFGFQNQFQYIVFNDENRIKQILINLVSNAIKFTFKGEITINASFDSQNRIIKFVVKDTGIGIPKHIQPQLFKLYSTYNLQDTNKGGIGLGLAISKKLVALLGPKDYIELRSEVDKGSEFSFVIYCYSPMCKQDSDHESNPSIQKFPKTFVQNKKDDKSDQCSIEMNLIKNNPNILIVDDMPFNIIALSQLIEKILQCQIDQAFSGKQAIEKAKAQNYDLILMDLNMPEIDGIQATKEIRKIQSQSLIKKSQIYIISAFSPIQDEEISLKAGADGYLEKPVKIKELEKILHDFLHVTIN